VKRGKSISSRWGEKGPRQNRKGAARCTLTVRKNPTSKPKSSCWGKNEGGQTERKGNGAHAAPTFRRKQKGWEAASSFLGDGNAGGIEDISIKKDKFNLFRSAKFVGW